MRLRSIEDINARKFIVEKRIVQIQAAREMELKRPYRQRRRGVCQFLDLEMKIYIGKMQELNWLLNE